MAIPIKGLVTLLFLITYLLVITNYKSKTKYVLAACLILIVSGVVTVREAISAINWNVIGIYVG
ncbi:MAG: hypothetical protein N3F05_05090, partial [Candidatus Diapherotrites archaeon]|nr:hypothetical protein [Candidatus Diapherotrites archaeon]